MTAIFLARMVEYRHEQCREHEHLWLEHADQIRIIIGLVVTLEVEIDRIHRLKDATINFQHFEDLAFANPDFSEGRNNARGLHQFIGDGQVSAI